MTKHIPVLLEESVKALNIVNNGCYIDATFGSGGHSSSILSKLGDKGRLFSLDKDLDAINSSEARSLTDSRFAIEHGCFSNLEDFTHKWGVHGSVNGILFDLGVSSYHFDSAERGFSFDNDGDIDMRYDQSRGLNAYDWIRDTDEKELADVIWRYGDERYSRRIARAIVNARKLVDIRTTHQLADIINKSIPKTDHKKNNATRTFQAIRIFVNKELDVLKKALKDSYEILAPKGRLVLITYHSLEDRVIKDFLIHTDESKSLPKKMPVKNDFLMKMFNLISKSIKPTASEINSNKRARSAKLNILERCL